MPSAPAVATKKPTCGRRGCHLGSALLGWWGYLYWQVADRLFQQQRSQASVNALLSAFSLAGLAAGIGWSAWVVANSSLSPGQFAALIVLDEPTASLDPQAEADVFRRFLAMSGERTTIVVSHRLGSARMCDRILVLKEGRLLENGTHGELLSQGGEYARLWALQAQWYDEREGAR